MSASLVTPEKISSANSLFEELYTMVYENLCSILNPPYALRNVLNNFFDTVRIVSLQDVEEEEIEGSYFFSGYRDDDAVFYPFQDGVVVDSQVFLSVTSRWLEILIYLEEYAEGVEDAELTEKANLLDEKFNSLVFF